MPEDKTIFSQKHRAAIAKARIGKKHSEETKAKIKASLKKKYELRKRKILG